MSKLQKMAIFNIASVCILLLSCFVVLLFIIHKDGTNDIWNHSGSLASICCIFLLVLLIFQSWPNKKNTPDNKIHFDERDKTIQLKSIHKALWGFFGVFMWMAWLMIHPELHANIALPILLSLSTSVGIIVYSASVLIQYGWTNKGEKS